MEKTYYSSDKSFLLKEFNSSDNGISSNEARIRLKKFGLNEIPEKDKRSPFSVFSSQFKSPLVIILIIASVIALVLREITEAIIIMIIIILNSLLSFYQEFKSEKAIQVLKKYVSFNAEVIRDEEKIEIDSKELVPGDIVLLNIGDVVPADIRLLESEGLSVNEATLTGESNEVKKSSDVILSNKIPISEQRNILFMSSIVTYGSGKGIVIATGRNTVFGKTAMILSSKEPPSDFQKNMTGFGSFLLKLIVILTVFVFLANALLNKGMLNSLLFALALAVGVTPELLPIIITISLSKGAQNLAKKKVIVKKLASIEDLGNIDVLCIDKTGTLTENKMYLQGYYDCLGKKNLKILEFASLCNQAVKKNNSFFGNPIDIAIMDYIQKEKISSDYENIKDIEFDYSRRRMSSIIKKDRSTFLISKGSPISIIEICKSLEKNNEIDDIRAYHKKLLKEFENASKKGFRVISIAYKEIEKKKYYSKEDEKDMIFLGFITFLDPPKKTAEEALKKFKELKVDLKILTGDNEIITKKICQELNIKIKTKIITGEELDKLSEDKFFKAIEERNVFARVTPAQKFKIVELLNKKGHIVGFLGDGINDAPALKVADVGITVNNAVDVAKESADIILLMKSLDVVADGIREGRKTFGNITKYILNTISANFGNMFTLSISSLYLNFIPLLPSQVLLNNFISDIPLTTVSTDNVDKGYLKKPKRWDIKMIYKFMIFFGLISSIFDILIMLAMWLILFPGKIELFRTAWFMESALSEIIITFVIRTKKPFWKSKPSKLLVLSSLFGIALVLFFIYLLPYEIFEFKHLSLSVVIFVFFILCLYVFLAELGKKIFYRKDTD